MLIKTKSLITAGFKIARAITKKYAKTFYLSSFFLPKDKRLAAYSIYAICRVSDEAVDNAENLSLNKITKIQAHVESIYNNSGINEPLLLAFKETVDKYNIPKRYFDELIDGMYMDLNKNRYGNFTELYSYCYKVAGVVGLVMLKVFGYNDKDAEIYAIDLGIAMQLTNILRDIKEDLLRERIYLPQDELCKFGVSENQLRSFKADENFKSLLKFQIRRARDFYKSSEKGIKLIPDKKSRFVILNMKEIYSGILDSIEKNDYDVFSARAHVNIIGKINRTLKTSRRMRLYEN